MPTDNSLTDLKYKVILRTRAAWEMTAFTQDPDNPANLTETEIADFKTFRNKWNDLLDVVDNGTYDPVNGGVIGNLDDPPLPSGWIYMTRSTNDLPDVIIRKTDCDAYDNSFPAVD